MSLSLFLAIVALIVLSAVIYLVAMLVFAEFMLNRTTKLQRQFLADLEDDDLDDHASTTVGMQFFNNN